MDRLPRFVAACRWKAMNLDYRSHLLVVPVLRRFAFGYQLFERLQADCQLVRRLS